MNKNISRCFTLTFLTDALLVTAKALEKRNGKRKRKQANVCGNNNSGIIECLFITALIWVLHECCCVITWIYGYYKK